MLSVQIQVPAAISTFIWGFIVLRLQGSHKNVDVFQLDCCQLTED